MNINAFYTHNLYERMALVRRLGEFISKIRYYGYYISLYILEGEYIEVYYNQHSKTIIAVEILDPLDEKLNRYAVFVNLADLFKG